eukprot:scaffold121585_cov17-Prasinocladus_malaysianus.AAC.2
MDYVVGIIAFHVATSHYPVTKTKNAVKSATEVVARARTARNMAHRSKFQEMLLRLKSLLLARRMHAY